jgi:hypothetical protein
MSDECDTDEVNPSSPQGGAKTQRACRPLTPREVQFCENLLIGLNQTEALIAAAPHLKGRWTQKSIHEQACKMAADPRLKAYIENALQSRVLRREYRENDLLSRLEKRGILATCARSDEADWGQRLTAIKVDNDMTGDAVLRIEQEVTLSVILKSLENTSPLPTEKERAMLAEPVHALPVAEGLQPSAGESGSSMQIGTQKPEGPFTQDFRDWDVEQKNESRPRGGSQLKPHVRAYEE